MSTKAKQTMETKRKGARKKRTTSIRNGNGDNEDTKDRAGKRGREQSLKDELYDEFNHQDLYKNIIDIVPTQDCSPAENPATPGTRVNLHGIILHETQAGLIVLNIRWRNQVYSGALIDVDKTKWASQRITGDLDETKLTNAVSQPPLKKNKIPVSALLGDQDNENGNNRKKVGTTSPPTPSKQTNKSSRLNGKKRASAETISPPPPPVEESSPAKKNKMKIVANGDSTFECKEPNCGKKYKNKNGLFYHRRTAHSKKADSFDEKDNKSDDSDSGEDNFVIDEKADEEDEHDEEQTKESNESENDVKSNQLQQQQQQQTEENEQIKINEEPSETCENPITIDAVKTEEDIKPDLKTPILLSITASSIAPLKLTNDTKEIDVKTEKTDVEDGRQIKTAVVKTEPITPNKPGKPPFGATPVSDMKSILHASANTESNYKNIISTGILEKFQDSKPIPSQVFPPQKTSTSITVSHSPSIPSIRIEKQSCSNLIPSVTLNAPTLSTTAIKIGTQQHQMFVKGEEPLQLPPGIISSHALSSPSHHVILSAQNQNKPLHPHQPLQRRGSQIINSLNELFVPSQNYQQFSPTLSSLNPQKINESLTDALTKQTTVVSSSAPLTMSKFDNTKVALVTRPSLEIKTSDLFQSTAKVMQYVDLYKGDTTRLKEAAECSDDERSISPENILTAVHKIFPQQDRDVKSSSSTTIKNIFPNATAFLNPQVGGKLLSNSAIIGSITQSNTFENTLLFRDLAAKVKNEAPNIKLLPGRPQSGGIDQKSLGPQVLKLETDGKTAKAPSVGSIDGKLGNHMLESLQASALVGDEKAKPSLLKQRLLLNPETTMNTTNKYLTNKSNNPLIPITRTITTPQHQTPAQHLQQPAQILITSATCKDPVADFQQVSSDKINVTSMTLTSNRDVNDKSKMATVGGSLRINPPASSDEHLGTSNVSWLQHSVDKERHTLVSPKEYFPSSTATSTAPSNSSSFRMQYSKSLSVNDLQIHPTSSIAITSSDASKQTKQIPVKRSVAIAPAPKSNLTSRSDHSQSNEYPINESGGEYFHRFTLTSDKGLVSSPTENRGRPKKIRVQNTDIPIGTAQEMARSRGASESPVPRKATSPVVRPSVIQGSIHPQNPSIQSNDHMPKPISTDRKGEVHMFQHPRNIEHIGAGQIIAGNTVADERLRFQHQQQQGQPSGVKVSPNDPTRNVDKYKRIVKSPPGSSIPGMHYNPQSQNRQIFSPPLSRNATISPRSSESVQRSPTTGFPHEVNTKAAYLQYSLEGARDKYQVSPVSSTAGDQPRIIHEQMRKQEAARVNENRGASETARMAELTTGRTSILSSPSSSSLPPSFRSPHDMEKERVNDYMAFNRHQSPRSEIPTPRAADGSRGTIFEHRGSVDDSEQARARDHFLQAPSIFQPNLYNSRTSSTPPPSAHSTNLVLRRGDGPILAKITNSYDARSTTENKR